MSDVTVTSPDDLVKEAKGWADALLARVHQGPGDTLEASMHRAEAKYAIPAQTFWAFRYGRLKDISAYVYLRLKTTYEAECGRQEARLRHELEITKALPTTPARAALIADAEALLGEQESEPVVQERDEHLETGGVE